MWLKVLGSVFVILSGTYTGFKLANRFSERPSQIRQIRSCLTSLKSYVNYVAMPLPEALAHCTSGVDGPVSKLFQKTGELLGSNGCLNPKEALEFALKSLEHELSLAKTEIDILRSLGANLGLINCAEQERYIAMIENQLQEIEREAIRFRDQNAKMYRYLGICSGLIIVIIML